MRAKVVQKSRELTALVLVFVFIVGMFQGKGITFAYEAKTGIIYAAGGLVETKKEPSDQAEKVRSFEFGKSVTILDEVTDAEGNLWYLISYILKSTGNQESSYCRAEYVRIDEAFATGEVNANEVSLRDMPGTNGTNILIQLNVGAKVEIYYETSIDDKLWYRVKYQAPDTVDAQTGATVAGQVYIGWMREKYITIHQYLVDEEYKQQLLEAGFPESYVNGLAMLHARYPEWIFTPVKTGLNWQDVIDGETLKADGSSRPINMVGISYDDSMKSVHPDDYDWETNTWVIRDGDNWVAVHPDYLAHLMDPRNFLTEEYIFQFESLSYSEAHNIEGVNAVIGSSFMSKDAIDSDGSTFNYATAFMAIAKEVGVSPYHLVTRVRQEQGNKGTSSLISGTYKGYEGYYNYFNFGAHGVTDKAVIEAGLKYAQNKGWDTRYKALKGGAEQIAKNYISKGQDTVYFQKFNVVYKGKLYSHQYMAAVRTPSSEAKSIARAYTDKHQAFVFRIPIYENMPEKAVEFTATGNPNNYLSDITVEGLSLSPTFRGAVTDYTITVENAIRSITVSAAPVVSKSTVSGAGRYDLQEGVNTIKIVCVSESGSERIYTITVVREEGEEPSEPGTDEPGTGEPGTNEPGTNEPDTNEPGTDEPSTDEPGTNEPGTDEPSTEEPKPVVPAGITSQVYQLGTYITGLEPGTTAEVFLKGITCSGNATVKLLDKNGAQQTGVVGTGNVLQVYDGNTLIKSYETVVYGDVSGDGKVNTLDAIKLNRYTIGLVTLNGAYLEAADANRDSRRNTLDSIIINRYTIGLADIKQK